MRWFYLLSGFLLLPISLTLSLSLASLLRAWWSLPGDTGSFAVLNISLGVMLWLLIHLFLPLPTRLYIFAHELTHALWGIVFGARLCGIKVARDSGHVKLTEHNCLVVLAPYFFPLYAILILFAWWVFSWFFGFDQGRFFWLLGVGACLGFHFAFTIRALTQGQTDLLKYGRFFSYSLIYCGNIIFLLWLVTIISGIAFTTLWEQILADAQTVRSGIGAMLNLVKARLFH